MRVETLRAVRAVVEHGSLTAAADVLAMSEPALSRRIGALEAEIGLVLFDRSRRSLRPTETACALLQEAEPILSGIERIGDLVGELRAGARRRLRLVTMPRLVPAIAAPVIARFKAEHPEVALSVDVQPHRMLETWIAGQRFDLGLSALPARHRDIDTRLLMDLPAVAVLPADHPLAGAEEIAVEALSGDPFVTLSPGTLLRRQTEEIFGRANALLAPAMEVSQAQLACQLVALGAGVTICDPMVPTAFGDRLASVPIAPRHTMSFGMHFLRGREIVPEAEALVRITREAADAFLEARGLPPGPAR